MQFLVGAEEQHQVVKAVYFILLVKRPLHMPLNLKSLVHIGILLLEPLQVLHRAYFIAVVDHRIDFEEPFDYLIVEYWLANIAVSAYAFLVFRDFFGIFLW